MKIIKKEKVWNVEKKKKLWLRTLYYIFQFFNSWRAKKGKKTAKNKSYPLFLFLLFLFWLLVWLLFFFSFFFRFFFFSFLVIRWPRKFLVGLVAGWTARTRTLGLRVLPKPQNPKPLVSRCWLVVAAARQYSAIDIVSSEWCRVAGMVFECNVTSEVWTSLILVSLSRGAARVPPTSIERRHPAPRRLVQNHGPNSTIALVFPEDVWFVSYIVVP